MVHQMVSLLWWLQLAHGRVSIMCADLQMVNMSLRILSKPSEEKLPTIWKVRCLACWCHSLLQSRSRSSGSKRRDSTLTCLFVLWLQGLGVDWEDRVLPSIGNEIVKATVAQFNAEQLLTQREKVSLTVSPQGH
jgi:prohibitin 1